MVLWHHAPLLLRAPASLFASTFWRMSATGWMGVDLFFVLSGFLITGILLRSRGAPHQLRRFWARRALRIFPVAVVYLGVVYFTARVFGFPPLLAHFNRWTPFVFYFGNIDIALHGWVDSSLAILWSLAIEEHFYALWPLAARWLTPRRLGALCVAIALAGPAIRWFTWPRLGPIAVYVSTWCRIDNLAIGGALAVGFHEAGLRERVVRACRWLAIPSLAVIALALAEPFGMLYPAHNPRWFAIFGYSAIALSFAVLVGLAADPAPAARPVLNNPVLRYIGRKQSSSGSRFAPGAGSVEARRRSTKALGRGFRIRSGRY
jgi:peptidoglycan/LPS O-acetylase OafA/YrhL